MKKLLPVGFYDLLFEEAKKNHQNINLVLEYFFSCGYNLIKTPLVEFEDSFSTIEIRNYFRTNDIISGKNLIFRNDITPQIARLISSRLNSEKLPLKLCYSGDVLCAKNEELYADRQQTQVGLEIIGCDQEKSSFEIISNLLIALDKLKIGELLIEFSLPDFLTIFLDETGIKNSDELREAIMKKNLNLVKKLLVSNHHLITKIMLLNDNLEKIIADISLPKISTELKKAQKISEFLKKNFTDVKVRFDLFGDNSSSYHHEISFDIFCKNFSYPIARGGRYKINQNLIALDAVGATIYINHLRKI
jgi:ATP phosphoribosyltransferase regulatory subunit